MLKIWILSKTLGQYDDRYELNIVGFATEQAANDALKELERIHNEWSQAAAKEEEGGSVSTTYFERKRERNTRWGKKLGEVEERISGDKPGTDTTSGVHDPDDVCYFVTSVPMAINTPVSTFIERNEPDEHTSRLLAAGLISTFDI